MNSFENDVDMVHCRLDMHRIAESATPGSALDAWFAKWRDKLDDMLNRDMAGEVEAVGKEAEDAKEGLEEAEDRIKEKLEAITEAIGHLEAENLRRGDVEKALAALRSAIKEGE